MSCARKNVELQRSLEFLQAEIADLKTGIPSALFVADTDATIQGMLENPRENFKQNQR